MRVLVVVCLSVLLGAALMSDSAWAQPRACNSSISASARATNGLNLVPPQTYDTQELARSRAIAAWQGTVAARCPRRSSPWRRAKGRKVDCDGYAGGISCEVSATPARRLL